MVLTRAAKIAILGWSLSLACAGCTKISLPKFFVENAPPTTAAGGASGFQVKVDGYGRPLTDGQLLVANPDEFLREVNKLLAEEREFSASFFVTRRLDTALEVLKQVDARAASGREALLIARAYDESLGLSPQTGWQAVLKDRAARGTHASAYEKARRDILDGLRSGTLSNAAPDKLSASAAHSPGVMLKLDALQLRGVVYLVTDQPQQAAEVFAEAQQLANAVDGFQGTQMGLLRSDALRRANDIAGANEAWKQTVINGADLVGRPQPIIDPTLWEKVAYLRPVSVVWPPIVVMRLLPHGPLQAAIQPSADDAEAVVWSAIGQAYLERDEAQASLVAFKRGEVAARSQIARDWLRWSQGRALAISGQPAAATAIWAQLTNHSDARLVKASTASLGSLKLQQGDLAAALRLFAKALDEQSFGDWPGRAEVEADFALATLMRGEQQQGLRRLHHAQQQFASSHQTHSLAKSLWNEAKFLEHSGQKKESQAIWERWKQIEKVSASASLR